MNSRHSAICFALFVVFVVGGGIVGSVIEARQKREYELEKLRIERSAPACSCPQ
jgi:hypothetical protein